MPKSPVEIVLVWAMMPKSPDYLIGGDDEIYGLDPLILHT